MFEANINIQDCLMPFKMIGVFNITGCQSLLLRPNKNRLIGVDIGHITIGKSSRVMCNAILFLTVI